MADPEPNNLERLRDHVETVIHNRHHSDAWLKSPNRNPATMLAAYTSEPLRTKLSWRHDRQTEESVPVYTPLEYMYTGDEMKAEILRKLHRAETEDPRAHPDYSATRFSVAELMEHVVPRLPKHQPNV